jgi:hypothetical protein
VSYLLHGISRKLRTSAFFWTLGTVILGPIILPTYLALRPLKEGEVREGGKAWNILKNFAILWTVVIAIGAIIAVIDMASRINGLTNESMQAGAGIGIAFGMGLFAAAWFFPTVGAALLGFLLKKTTIVETGPTGPLVGQQSAANAIGGWAICVPPLQFRKILIRDYIQRQWPAKANGNSPTPGMRWTTRRKSP